MIRCAAGPLLFGMAVLGCLGVEGQGGPRPPFALLAIDPTEDVQVGQAVRLTFSESVGAVEPGAVSVHRGGGAPVRSRVLRDEDPRMLRLTPDPEWPAGALLELALSGGLVDRLGRPVVPAEGAAFRTQGSGGGASGVVLRGPLPGRPAPVNLGWVLLAAPALPAAVDLRLEREGGPEVPLTVVARSASAVLAQLAAYRGPCDPLCPDGRYRVVVEVEGTPAVVRGDVRTSSVVDRTPPAPVVTRGEVLGDRLFIEVEGAEPVLVLGEIVTETEERFALELPDRFAPQVRVGAAGSLPSGVNLTAELRVVDSAMNAVDASVGPVRLPERPQVVLQEVVATPLRDWSDSEGGGVPFDNIPGHGAVNENDEWVELVNEGPEPVDLLGAGLELHALDGSPTVTPVAGAPQLFFGGGGALDNWLPGEALVVRVRGALSQRDLTLELWWGTVLLDRAVFSETTFSDHPGGPPPDAVHEAVARSIGGRWRWCVPSPGDPILSTDCR